MFTTLEIKKKILDYLKQRGSSSVNWSSIVQKFNLKKNRYNSSLIQELKKWYEKHVFNQFSFSLSEKIYKQRLKLCKLQGKSLIIKKYLKNRKISDSLLSWSKVKAKCLAGRYLSTYNREEWEPVKEWYIHSYKKISIKQGRLIMKADFEKEKDFSFIVFEEQVKLSQILITMFQTFEKEVLKRELDENVKRYYKNFFKIFNAKTITNNLRDNSVLITKQITSFKSVKNLTSFIEYLQNIPGLYQKLSLWAIKNPFPDKSRSQDHHIIPEFLHKISEFNLSLSELNPPNYEYNFVKVPWIIHFLLHYVRLIEYNQDKDINAINALRITSSKVENKKFESYIDPYKAIGSFYKNFIKNRDSGQLGQLLDSDIRSKLSTKQQLNVRRMTDQIKNILIQDTIWRHINEYYDTCPQASEFTFKGKSPDECSEMDLAIAICQAYNNRLKRFNLNKKQRTQLNQYKATRDMLSQYLQGKFKDQTTVHGFYLANNRPNNIRSPETNKRFIKFKKK